MSDFTVIDLEPWFTDSDEEKGRVVDAVREACRTIGFFLITGHRIDPALVATMYATSRAFFDLPEETKRRIPAVGPVPGGLEYFARETERLAATMGQETPPDIKETMDFGPGFGGVPWPDEPEGLETVWRAYYAAMDGLCRQLRGILACAADLPDDFFEPHFVDHLSSIRVINYPEPVAEPLPGQLRAGAHTDYGFLTVLLSEDRPGGLEVMNLEGRWVAPPALPGSFVVNLADSLMRWTDDRWHSTPHRVVNPPTDRRGESRRQSIAYFHNPARDALIATLPGFLADGKTAKYPPIAYGDYAMDRQRRASGYRGLWVA